MSILAGHHAPQPRWEPAFAPEEEKDMIHTLEELEALPVGAKVRSGEGRPFTKTNGSTANPEYVWRTEWKPGDTAGLAKTSKGMAAQGPWELVEE